MEQIIMIIATIISFTTLFILSELINNNKTISEESIFKFSPQYFITLNPDGFVIEIDIRKLNFIQKMMLRILGIKISKYDEKLIEKLTQKS